MITPRLISPILDGFQLNETISRRDGVLCCSATEMASGKHFAVQVRSLPASAVKLDALIMTGAFSDRASANSYFKEQARWILNEVKTLRYMATLGGFSDFDCVQVVPGENGCGFDVYMLSPWQKSLQNELQREDLTHLEVLNMGLDLCAALATCRHAGYYYANLKPGNVFRNGQHYRIGDLGFIPLSDINRIAMPEAFRCNYTPPELMDGSHPMNDTADVYALGLILYQAYNGGNLPSKNDIIGKLYAPPQYADYEIAQIILRACAPDPAIRWSDPVQMGRALTRYLQRNGMRNTPIIPPILQELAVKNKSETEPFLPEYADDDLPSSAPETGNTHPLPVRKRSARPSRRTKATRLFKNRRNIIAVAVLAAILVIELIVGIIVLGQRKQIEITDFRAELAENQQDVTIYLTYDGDAPDTWMVTFASKNEGARSVTFSGNNVTISDLTPGAEYTFTISASNEQTLTGSTEIICTIPDADP